MRMFKCKKIAIVGKIIIVMVLTVEQRAVLIEAFDGGLQRTDKTALNQIQELSVKLNLMPAVIKVT